MSGSSTSAPLVALLAGRRMAANEVDTNFKVFSTKLRTDEEFWREACADGLAAIVSSGGYFSQRYMRQSPSVKAQFHLAKRFADPMLTYGGSRPIDLWLLNDGLTGCEYRVQ